MWRRIDVSGTPTCLPAPLLAGIPVHPLDPCPPPAASAEPTPHTTLTAQLICRVDWNPATRLSNRGCGSSIFNAAGEGSIQQRRATSGRRVGGRRHISVLLPAVSLSLPAVGSFWWRTVYAHALVSAVACSCITINHLWSFSSQQLHRCSA